MAVCSATRASECASPSKPAYACEGLLDVGFAMGGRAIRTESLMALLAKSPAEVEAAFDAFAMQINRLNMEEDEAGERLL